MRDFHSLNEREILALAISLEEEDERVYADIADGLQQDFPHSAAMFEAMRDEESGHRHRLLELYQHRFGRHVPLVRRQDVKGFVNRRPIWLMRPLGVGAVRNLVASMEAETRRFYEHAASRTTDAGIRQLLNDLAQEERAHENTAHNLTEFERAATAEGASAAASEDEAKRKLFLLQVVQPGLAGLMDGSVSTLAPVFAAAFATKSTHDAFAVGLAASLGAGISMGFAEALSDDGTLTGRGHPWVRGFVCGAMTALGGFGHTLPFLIDNFYTALWAAIAVVVVELATITYIRHRYMETPPLSAALQVGLGGALVFVTGILIGRS